MPLPEHTSAAQLACYASCPRKYEYKYLHHAAPEYKSVSLALGAAVHSSIGWWFAEKLAGRQPKPGDVARIVRADLAAGTDDPAMRWGNWNAKDLEAHAQRCVAAFLDGCAELPVIGTEAKFTLEIMHPETGEVMPRRLVGYLDFVLSGGDIVELKTARSAYSAVDLATNLQFGAYRAAMLATTRAGVVNVITIVKNKAPRLQKEVLEPSAEAVKWFMTAASAIETAIATGIFPPAPSMMCSGCEYQKRCLGQEVCDVDAAA